MTWLRIGILVVFILLILFSPDPDRNYLFERSLENLLPEIISSIDTSPHGELLIRVEGEGEALPMTRSVEILAESIEEAEVRATEDAAPVVITLTREKNRAVARWTDGNGEPHTTTTRYIRWLSLLPPFVAILAALLFQRTIAALFLGIWLGTSLISGGNPITGLWVFLRVYLIQEALLDSFRVEIISFVIGLVALVGIISRGGGVQGMIRLMMRWVRSRRSAQFVTFAMGIVIFFDDYANTILVGSTMRPLTDRFRISREKLSYIVDSTAAPVAGLSLLSTWIAYEVSQFAPQIAEVGITENPYMIFARTLPFRFYSIFTLLFIFSGILMRREFGPMLKAERRSQLTGEMTQPGARPMISDAMTRITPKEGIDFHWFNGVLPLVTVVLVTLAGLWVTGNSELDIPKPLSGLFSLSALRDVIAGANSTRAISTGAWCGFLVGALLFLGQRILTFGEIVRAAFSSTRALFFAIVILFFAWCIGGVCRDIGTAHYLVALFRQSISPLLYPILLFILSCLVSFSTGSSWSTMAIILPNSVTLAWILGASSPLGAFGLTILSIGAVLEGSIFGDHCSPISDTTILSSVSSAADHIDHVRTQIPYALATMLVAIVCGYFPATRGVSSAITIPAGLCVIILIHLTLGRRVKTNRAGHAPNSPQ